MPRTYRDLGLRRGDSDAAQRWGGRKQALGEITPVAELQADLRSIGLLGSKPDGGFGGETETAVEAFQAAVVHGARSIDGTGAIAPVAAAPLPQDGIVDSATADIVSGLVDAGRRLTGWLVRLDSGAMAATALSDGFDRIANPSVGAADIVVDVDFASALRRLDQSARGLQVRLIVTQALRLVGDAVSGAIVPPAKKSQHLIGHAVDLNIADGDVLNNSRLYAAKKWTANAKQFADGAVAGGLRWNAKFSPVDPVHFDLQVDPNAPLWQAKYVLNQAMVALKHPIAAA